MPCLGNVFQILQQNFRHNLFIQWVLFMDVHIGCRKSLWSENLVIFLSGQWTHTRKAEEEKRKKKQSVVNLDEWSANTSRYMPAIPALERQGECESEAILDTLKRSCLKKKKDAKFKTVRNLGTNKTVAKWVVRLECFSALLRFYMCPWKYKHVHACVSISAMLEMNANVQRYMMLAADKSVSWRT